jgi:ABC-type multidrug transport system ATPase subunit
MIRLDSVSKRFPDGTIAVTDLSLEVPEGEISVLVGPSGCGKTTTLKMVNRLDTGTPPAHFSGTARPSRPRARTTRDQPNRNEAGGTK